MERRRKCRANHPGWVPNFTSAFDPVAVLHKRKQPIIGKNEVLPSLRFHHEGLTSSAHPGIDYDHENCSGRVKRGSTVKKTCAVQNRKRCDLMGEVDDAKIGLNSVHHALADGDRVVHGAEVSHEYNDGWSRWLRVLESRRRTRCKQKQQTKRDQHQPGSTFCNGWSEHKDSPKYRIVMLRQSGQKN